MASPLSFSLPLGNISEKYSILTSVKLPSLPLYYTFAPLHLSWFAKYLSCITLLCLSPLLNLPSPLSLTDFHDLHAIHLVLGLLSAFQKSAVFLTFDSSYEVVLSMKFQVPSISSCDCWQCVMIISRGIHTLFTLDLAKMDTVMISHGNWNLFK